MKFKEKKYLKSHSLFHVVTKMELELSAKGSKFSKMASDFKWAA